MADDLTAELGRIAEQVAGARKGFMPMGTTEYSRNVTQSHAPRLLAAVEAVLKLHQPVKDRTGAIVCRNDHWPWPCPEMTAIAACLTRPL